MSRKLSDRLLIKWQRQTTPTQTLIGDMLDCKEKNQLKALFFDFGKVKTHTNVEESVAEMLGELGLRIHDHLDKKI